MTQARPPEEAAVAAWNAARGFVVLVTAVRSAAAEDPLTWLPALAVIAADPVAVAAVFFMTAAARAR